VAQNPLWEEVCTLLRYLCNVEHLVRRILLPFAPYLVLLVGFLTFGLWNGGLAVGNYAFVHSFTLLLVCASLPGCVPLTILLSPCASMEQVIRKHTLLLCTSRNSVTLCSSRWRLYWPTWWRNHAVGSPFSRRSAPKFVPHAPLRCWLCFSRSERWLWCTF
jgi:hypothetical protein